MQPPTLLEAACHAAARHFCDALVSVEEFRDYMAVLPDFVHRPIAQQLLRCVIQDVLDKRFSGPERTRDDDDKCEPIGRIELTKSRPIVFTSHYYRKRSFECFRIDTPMRDVYIHTKSKRMFHVWHERIPGQTFSKREERVCTIGDPHPIAVAIAGKFQQRARYNATFNEERLVKFVVSGK
ncbi:hypothetical protein QKT49_gp346 [Acanthamoeba castellanii medusavirus]|uniref:Uncharacterized protein n=1 Tax=Acanthamoeba castellanii medusavirus J1 TaxID=3114988 RepID=A0A3T1CX56_9VIRU|nr:hypothetical protein QKT49_gp346 [Acanthamoeba castellanii medusavirus]BBI30417.1 hypothetical protein [Acanthamoeba castellanii medusavirus J1]